MANKAIPDLPAAAPLTGAEQFEVIQAGNSRRTTVAEIAGAGATAPGAPVDIASFAPGIPAADQRVMRYVAARAIEFPDDFAGSQGSASNGATALTVFRIRKNGSDFGLMVFGAGATTASFSTGAGALDCIAGDVIEVLAPSSPDATLANVALTLVAARM